MDFKTLSKSSDLKPLVFKPNITPVDVIKNQRFNQRFKNQRFNQRFKNQRFKKAYLVETYFRDIYCNRQINR